MNRYATIANFLTLFIENEVKKCGVKRVILGLSGGIDSAVVAVLAHRAFGEELLCVKMPSHYSSLSSLEDADELCKKFGIRSETVSIEPLLKVYCDTDLSNLRMGNLSARLRMATLFDISAREGALVLGTSNKSELMLGYGTIYGDLASAINPIGDLYKSEIFELANELGVPKSIINKPPSADLWEGQNDEDDLGWSYEQLDKVLVSHVEHRADKEELLEEGFERDLVEFVLSKIYQNQFKRKMPLIAKLTARTINHDFNYPRDITL